MSAFRLVDGLATGPDFVDGSYESFRTFVGKPPRIRNAFLSVRLGPAGGAILDAVRGQVIARLPHDEPDPLGICYVVVGYLGRIVVVLCVFNRVAEIICRRGLGSAYIENAI